jgi:hypothetical protein
VGTPRLEQRGRIKGNASLLGLAKKANVPVNPIQVREMTIWLLPKKCLTSERQGCMREERNRLRMTTPGSPYEAAQQEGGGTDVTGWKRRLSQAHSLLVKGVWTTRRRLGRIKC